MYKSIDKNGNTIYSSSPKNKNNTVEITIAPPPSKEEVQSSQQRYQQNLETDKTLEESRQKREQEIAEHNRLKRERNENAQNQQVPDYPQENGPYYGIPGRGIIVVPKGPRINPR